MSRKTFHNLLERYLEGKCTAAEKETVEQWYKMLDEDFADPSKEELQLIENRLWTKVSSKLNKPEEEVETVSPVHQFFADKRSMLFRAAAIAGFALLMSFLFFYSAQKNPSFQLVSKSTETVYRFNQTQKPMSIYLEDGSFVKLQPGSALNFPRHFSKQKREVYLTGEGYFLVSKNPAKPFLVYNNNTITRVVGTSFIIKTNVKTQQTEVSVQTGRVVVTENIQRNIIKSLLNKQAEVVLSPNEKTVYSKQDEQFKTTLVAVPLPVLKHNEQQNKTDFVFAEVPVAVVLKVLEKTYAIKIMAVKEVSDATFTGDISSLGLYNQLELICQSVHASYTVEGTTIYVKQ